MPGPLASHQQPLCDQAAIGLGNGEGAQPMRASEPAHRQHSLPRSQLTNLDRSLEHINNLLNQCRAGGMRTIRRKFHYGHLYGKALLPAQFGELVSSVQGPT